MEAHSTEPYCEFDLKCIQCIYALRRPSGEIFYVGLTRVPFLRIKQHRALHGQNFTFKVLEVVIGYTAGVLAEKDWIKRLAAQGAPLENKTNNPNVFSRSRPIQKGIKFFEEEFEPVKKAAAAIGFTVSDFIRVACLEKAQDVLERPSKSAA